MQIIIFTAADGTLWVMRPMYNDKARPRKPEYADLIPPALPAGETSVTVGDVTVTLDDTTVGGTTIYLDSKTERLNRFIAKGIAAPDAAIPLNADTAYHLVDGSDVPTDHSCSLRCEFRDSWEWDDGVKVNMVKARLQHMTRIRAVRDTELAKLDAPWMKAVEAGNTSDQATITTQKQTLRDLPATFSLDGYADPVALKAAWPSELPAWSHTFKFFS
jgi:hypothetical protein